MIRSSRLALIALSCLVLATPLASAAGISVHERAQFDAGQARDAAPEGVAARSLAELQAALGAKTSSALASLNRSSGIDFTKEMVLYASAGSQPAQGHTVDVTITELASSLDVEWELNVPMGAVQPIFMVPGELLVVDRYDGFVSFRQKGQLGQTTLGAPSPEPTSLDGQYGSLPTRRSTRRSPTEVRSREIGGTLTSTTADPDAWRIDYNRSGGFIGASLMIEIRSDGKVSVEDSSSGLSGPQAPLGSQELVELKNLVDKAISMGPRESDPSMGALSDGLVRVLTRSQAMVEHSLLLSEGMILRRGDMDLIRKLEAIAERQ